VVRGLIGVCIVVAPEELKTSGTDDVCECWPVSTWADLFIRNVGRPGEWSIRACHFFIVLAGTIASTH